MLLCCCCHYSVVVVVAADVIVRVLLLLVLSLFRCCCCCCCCYCCCCCCCCFALFVAGRFLIARLAAYFVVSEIAFLPLVLRIGPLFQKSRSIVAALARQQQRGSCLCESFSPSMKAAFPLSGSPLLPFPPSFLFALPHPFVYNFGLQQHHARSYTNTNSNSNNNNNYNSNDDNSSSSSSSNNNGNNNSSNSKIGSPCSPQQQSV